jgi:hypothetical protein
MKDEGPYLWDRSGPVDPDVAELERLLGSLRAGDGPRPSALPPEDRGEKRRRWPWWAAAATAAAAALLVWLRPSAPEAHRADISLRLEDGDRLAEQAWFTAERDGTRIELDRFGELTLAKGSRLQVQKLAREGTHLFLQRGELEAFVNLDARARFFQVGTPATRCVDLGCHYVLTVGDDGVASVHVTSGRVAFEDRGRQVLVPRGAKCRAWPGRGAGTPRYEDAPAELVAALDRFDGAEHGSDRSQLVAPVLAALADAASRDVALTLWHLMLDPAAAVADPAHRVAEEQFGRPADVARGSSGALSPADAEIWRQHLGL